MAAMVLAAPALASLRFGQGVGRHRWLRATTLAKPRGQAERMILGCLGMAANDQCSRAQSQTSDKGAYSRSRGTGWPRNASARLNKAGASSGCNASARVCFDNFSPAELAATGKWA